MIKQHQLLFVVAGLILAAVLAFWPGQWLRQAEANVTLVSFTAKTLPGQPEVYVDWETATQFQTLGFYITRSDNADGPWTRVSEFVPREGDDLTGAVYPTWIDDTTVLNHFYSYKLEEITQSDSEFYGPVAVVAGVGTPTPTPTSVSSGPTTTITRTPTTTPSPTATPTVHHNSNSTTSSSSSRRVEVTPRVATGATITPLPGPSGSASSPATLAATPTPVQLNVMAQQAALPATTVPPVVDAATTVAVVPPPLAPASPLQPQALAVTLAPTNAAAAAVEPIIIATEVSPMAAATAGSTNTVVLLLVGAAFLFLGLAVVILRQIRS
jgi:hypothetical protein